jgi:hypothetical protein
MSEILEKSKDLAPKNAAFLRILELAYRGGARFYIQSNDLENKEWVAEYASLYSKIYPPQPNYVIRLDFFKQNPLALIHPIEDNYLGFVALRPGPKRTIVECTIKPPNGNASHFLLCKITSRTKYPVDDSHFQDAEIKDYCPFLQQDNVIGVCAHACLKMVSGILKSNFIGCADMTFEEISQKIQLMPSFGKSHLPSSGLREDQLFSVLESMGTDPQLIQFDQGREKSGQKLTFDQVVYPYIESGIPVLGGINVESAGHAIIVVGHTFDKDSWWQKVERDYYPTLTSGTTWTPSYIWSPEFIIQDDNFGSYLSVSRFILRTAIRSILIPLPKSCHILLSGYYAESLASSYLQNKSLRHGIYSGSQVVEPWRSILKEIWEKGISRKIVLRPLIISKENFLTHINTVLPAEIVNIYSHLNLPPWIWSIEISTLELYPEHQKIGEILLNPTYPENLIQNGTEPLLAIRIFDVVASNNTFSTGTLREPVKIYTRASY